MTAKKGTPKGIELGPNERLVLHLYREALSKFDSMKPAEFRPWLERQVAGIESGQVRFVEAQSRDDAIAKAKR